jgi:hypothetical protein
MPRVNPKNTQLFENLSRYKITSLTLYGTGNRKVEISQTFIGWLTNELQPVVEFISLKNLNLCDLDSQTWTKFLSLCNSNCKFSVSSLHTVGIKSVHTFSQSTAHFRAYQ